MDQKPPANDQAAAKAQADDLLKQLDELAEDVRESSEASQASLDDIEKRVTESVAEIGKINERLADAEQTATNDLDKLDQEQAQQRAQDSTEV